MIWWQLGVSVHSYTKYLVVQIIRELSLLKVHPSKITEYFYLYGIYILRIIVQYFDL